MRGGGTANAAAVLLLGLTLGLTLVAGTASAQQKDRKAGAAPSTASAASPATTKDNAAAYAQRFASLCAACHGANGRSDMPGTPVLAGQHALYTITQLFLFREGRRANEAMSAVAKSMTDADLRGFADHVGTLPPVAPAAPATPPDAARMSKGQALAQQHKCAFCHGADLAGGQQVPRIGGQHEDYLRMTLKGFHDSTRAGYTRAMAEALSQVPAEDLDVLAYYAARVPVAVGK
jgi:cytochrome c553